MWIHDACVHQCLGFLPKEVDMALRVGQIAPDFTLENHLGEKTNLSDYLGKKNVFLAFFPLAWTPV
jgi:peroxiredoxin